jgi:hypothetical protein
MIGVFVFCKGNSDPRNHTNETQEFLSVISCILVDRALAAFKSCAVKSA